MAETVTSGIQHRRCAGCGKAMPEGASVVVVALCRGKHRVEFGACGCECAQEILDAVKKEVRASAEQIEEDLGYAILGKLKGKAVRG